MQAAQEACVREVVGESTSVDQIAKAKSMVESGDITPAEYQRLKDKALA